MSATRNPSGTRLDRPGGTGHVHSVRRVAWRDVAVYLALTFGLSWGLAFTALASGMRFGSLGGTGMALLVGMMFVPALSAFVTRRFVTREGFRTAGLRLGPRRPYLAVWIGVPLLFGAIYLISAALGFGRFDPTGAAGLEQLRAMIPPDAAEVELPPPHLLLLGTLAATLTIGLLVTTVATFGEEFGWTGYLLPKLLPLGRWKAALLYGGIWGLWHAPIIWGGYNYPGHPWLGIGMMMLFTAGLALIQTGLWLRSGSVFLTSFFHAAINSQGRGVWTLLVVDVPPLLGGALGLVGIASFAAVGAWLVHSAPGTTGPAEVEAARVGDRGTPEIA